MLLSRALIVMSVLLLGVHAILLQMYGQVPPGPVISGLAQLAIGGLCIAATANAALMKGASVFERRFLWLVVVRYLIWAVAQSLATHYERTGNEEFAGSPADVLFHLEDVPLGIAFFLDPGRESDRVRRPRLLDVLQILLFWGAVALYIRLMTAGADAGVGLVTATNALVAGCFYLRALTSRSSTASALFGRWTPAILLSTVNDGYAGFYANMAGGTFDAVWALESVVWTVTAATWRPARSIDPLDPRPAVDRTVHLLPLVVSCFALVLAIGIAQKQLFIAATIMTLAVGLSGASLLRARMAGNPGRARSPTGG